MPVSCAEWRSVVELLCEIEVIFALKLGALRLEFHAPNSQRTARHRFEKERGASCGRSLLGSEEEWM